MRKALILICFLLPCLVKATTYTSAANGNWSSSATWSPTGVPGSGDNVTIANTVTLDANESVNSITVNSSQTFTVSGSNTLTVYGNFTNNGTFTSSTGTITFGGSSNETISGSGSISFYNLTSYPSSSTDTVFLNKAITVSNNFGTSNGVFACETFSITGNSTGTMTMASGTTLLLGLTSSSTLVGFPSNFTSANISLNVASTVIFQADNTTSGQSISFTPTYGNLTITTSKASNTGIYSSVLTVAGNLTIGANIVFTQNLNKAVIDGNMIISSGAQCTENGILYLGGNLTNNGKFIQGSGTEVILNGTSNQTIIGTYIANTKFNELIYNPSPSTDTLFVRNSIYIQAVFANYGITFVPASCYDTIDFGPQSGFNNSGTFTALNGVAYFSAPSTQTVDIQFNPPTFYKVTSTCYFYPLCNFTVTSDYTSNAGTTYLSSGYMTLGGNFINNAVATVSGAVTMNGSHNQTIGGTTATTFQNLTINTTSSTDTVKLANNLTMSGNFIITQGAFDVSPSNYSLTIERNVFTNDGNFVARNGTVTFNGAVYSTAQNISGTSVTTFNNLVSDAYSTTTLANNVIINGNLTNTAGTFDVSTSNYNITLGGNFTNNATFNGRSGLVTLNGSANQTLGGTGSLTFYKLTQNQAAATDTVFMGEAITVNNNLTLTNGIFDCQNYQLTGNSTGTFTMASGTGLVLGLPSSATNISFPTTFTTAHTTLNSACTVTYQANTGQTISTTPSTYGNLVLSTGSSGTSKTPASSPLTIAGSLTINSNATLPESTGTINLTGNLTNAGTLSFTSGALNIGGSLTNNGTFTYGTSTVTCNGSPIQSINGSAYPTFYNLTISGGSGQTVSLGYKQTIINNLTITSGTLDATLSNYSLLIGGSFSKTGGTFTPRSDTVTMNGSSGQALGGSSALTMNKLVIGTSGTTTLGGNITTNSTITINSGATLDASISNYSITTAGNWTDNGAFTHRSGSVTFNASGNQCVADAGGTETFQNMTVSPLTILGTSSTIINIDGTIAIQPGGQMACICH